MRRKLVHVVGDTATGATQRERWTNDGGEKPISDCFFNCLFEGMRYFRTADSPIRFPTLPYEIVRGPPPCRSLFCDAAIISTLYFFKYAFTHQVQRTIETGLATHGRQ